MLTELQTIFLTCCLGPEDKTAFARSQKCEATAIYRAKNLEKCRAATLKSKQKRRDNEPEEVREMARKARRELYAERRGPAKVKATAEEKRLRKNARSLERYHAFSEEERKHFSENGEKWKADHKDRIKECRLIRYARDPAPFQESSRKWKKDHPEDASASQRRTNVKRKEAILEDQNNRYATNLNFKLGKILRSRLLTALRGVKGKKVDSALLLLGCSIENFKAHLESLFRPGMSWENHGPVWHIDHIKPCAAFDLADPEQQKVCFHWSNQQPLSAQENFKKGGRYVR